MPNLADPLAFRHGPTMKNRFMLAPMTNTQSHEDGTLSEEEYHWLVMRAEGGFGLTMTCAAHVQEIGKGFPGQLGIFSDQHLQGLSRLAAGIRSHDSLAVVQLHHAGMRSPSSLIGTAPVSCSDDAESGARALSHREVRGLVEDFVKAAERAEQAGFDGVEVHGAHGYIITQFLSPAINVRRDEYGGNPTNRSRILLEIIDGIRARCRPNFIIGVRISPEKFGLRLDEMIELAAELLHKQEIDFLDLSLWDSFKEPEEEVFQGRSLMSYFTELDRGMTRLGVAGKIRTHQDARRALDCGADWVMLGRAAILHHDYPIRCWKNDDFRPVETPVTREYLRNEGVSKKFIDYLTRWPDLVSDD